MVRAQKESKRCDDSVARLQDRCADRVEAVGRTLRLGGAARQQIARPHHALGRTGYRCKKVSSCSVGFRDRTGRAAWTALAWAVLTLAACGGDGDRRAGPCHGEGRLTAGQADDAALRDRPAAPDSAIVACLPGPVAMEFVWIEPGSFMMGSPASDPRRSEDEEPQHEVTLTRGYYLGRYEITQGQWEGVMGTTPWQGQKYTRSNPDHPAVYISWEDVQAFIGQLNRAAGEELYRFPTEAEWAWACRAGTTTPWWFGEDVARLPEYAWYAANAWTNVWDAHALPVGTKLPNPWGLYDMYGNAMEWVGDWNSAYADTSQTDPTGPSAGSHRVIKGGDFGSDARYVRSAFRCYHPPDACAFALGARLVKTR